MKHDISTRNIAAYPLYGKKVVNVRQARAELLLDSISDELQKLDELLRK